MKRLWAIVAAILIGGAITDPASAEPPAFAAFYEKRAAFDEVRQDVVDAIIKRGFVIDFNAHIAAMLRRTGQDLGAGKDVYAAAEAVHFCSAKLSRAMIEADPANIVLCPFVVVVYERADKPGTVHVGYRRMPTAASPESKTAFAAIERTLDAIATEATR